MIDYHLSLKRGEFKLLKMRTLWGSLLEREKSLKEALLTTFVCKATRQSLRSLSQLFLRDTVFSPHSLKQVSDHGVLTMEIHDDQGAAYVLALLAPLSTFSGFFRLFP